MRRERLSVILERTERGWRGEIRSGRVWGVAVQDETLEKLWLGKLRVMLLMAAGEINGVSSSDAEVA
jgi:hypothetical protein